MDAMTDEAVRSFVRFWVRGRCREDFPFALEATWHARQYAGDLLERELTQREAGLIGVYVARWYESPASE